MTTVAEAYDLLRGEGSVWACDPDALRALAIRVAAGPSAAADGRAQAHRNTGRAAVIPIMGPLMRRGSRFSRAFGLSSYSELRAEIANAAGQREIERVVLYIDSPGGAADGCEEVATDVAKLGKLKPVVAFVEGYSASAAYWITSQAQTVIATPSSGVGSIGVFSLHVDASRAIDAAGLSPTFIVSRQSPHKVEGNETQPLAKDALDYQQRQVDEMAARFVGAVANGRGVSAQDVTSRYGGGRVVAARDAKRIGMIDRIDSDFGATFTVQSNADRFSRVRGSAAGPDAADPHRARAAARRRRLRLEELR